MASLARCIFRSGLAEWAFVDTFAGVGEFERLAGEAAGRTCPLTACT